MKVSGFTICRNSVKFGFPFLESIKSLAPYCDEIVVALDETGDGTREALGSLNLPCPVRIIESKWNLENMRGGGELATQTNVALDNCKHEVVFYLQSDEVLHEDDAEEIKKGLERLAADAKIAAITFDWIHFYADPQTYVQSRKWYRREIRAFKKSSGLRSYLDAQSFRKKTPTGWQKLPALATHARVLHYGHVRPADLMSIKVNDLKEAWSGDTTKSSASSVFKTQYGIRAYEGTHPEVMSDYLLRLPKPPVPAYKIFNPKRFQLKFVRYFLSDVIEKISGYRMGEFKNYSKLYKK